MIWPNLYLCMTREKADKEAAEKAAREKADKEAAEKAACEKADKEAAEKAAREKADKEVILFSLRYSSFQFFSLLYIHPLWVEYSVIASVAIISIVICSVATSVITSIATISSSVITSVASTSHHNLAVYSNFGIYEESCYQY